jgi:hypothetical protein
MILVLMMSSYYYLVLKDLGSPYPYWISINYDSLLDIMVVHIKTVLF